MSIYTVAVAYVTLFILLSGGLAWCSYQLVLSNHPVFAVAFGVGGLMSLLCAATVEIKRKP